MQSPYTAYSPVSWYNREESHSGQLYHLYKAVLSLCPEYDTSLRYYNIFYPFLTMSYKDFTYICKWSGQIDNNLL